MTNQQRVMPNIKTNSLIHKTALVVVLLVVGIFFGPRLLGQQGSGFLGKTSGQSNEVKQVAFTGNVRDHVTGAPSVGTLVTIEQVDSKTGLYRTIMRDTTNKLGKVNVKIPEGKTHFIVQPKKESGYEGMETEISITGPELTYWFQMSGNGNNYPPGSEDEPGYAKVIGYVVDEEGNPLEGVRIELKYSNTVFTTKKDGSYLVKVHEHDKSVHTVPNTFMGLNYGPTVDVADLVFSSENYEEYDFRTVVSGNIGAGAWIVPITLKLKPSQQNQYNTQTYKTPPTRGGFDYETMGNQNYSDCIQKAVVVRYNGTVNVNPPCCGTGSITCTQNVVVTIEDYVKNTLPNEWIPSYHSESLKAGAVAIRSYVLYRMLYYPASTNNYHAIAGTCFQAYGSQQSNTTTAVNVTTGKIMTRSNGNVAYTEYSSENNNAGNACYGGTAPYGNGYVANTDGTYAANLTGSISDIVGANRHRNGHGRGMCQVCSQTWASGIYASATCGYINGVSNYNQSTGQGQKSYTWILQHYYPSFTLKTNSTCSFTSTCSGVTTMTCKATQTLANQTTVGNPNYFSVYNNSSCVGWNMNGPEKVYKITPSSSGTITAKLVSPSNANLRVFIVKASSCSVLSPSTNGQVLASGTSSTSTVSTAVSSGQVYFIIVDGKQVSGSVIGQSGTYSLTVTAPCPAFASTQDPSTNEEITIANDDERDVFEKTTSNLLEQVSWLSFDSENGWTVTVSSGDIITITDITGKVIKTLESREDGELWLPKLPSGMYIVTVCCDGEHKEKIGKITY